MFSDFLQNCLFQMLKVEGSTHEHIRGHVKLFQRSKWGQDARQPYNWQF